MATNSRITNNSQKTLASKPWNEIEIGWYTLVQQILLHTVSCLVLGHSSLCAMASYLILHWTCVLNLFCWIPIYLVWTYAPSIPSLIRYLSTCHWKPHTARYGHMTEKIGHFSIFDNIRPNDQKKMVIRLSRYIYIYTYIYTYIYILYIYIMI